MRSRPATSTDARNATTTYNYDALNRVASIAYAIGGVTDQTLVLSYDSAPNGKGRLAAASDAVQSLTWAYDGLGRVTNKTQTVGTTALSVGYAYANGNLVALTTPSGKTITYGYNDNHQVVSVAVNGTYVVTNATYEPWGGLDGWTWGNGTQTVRAYDTDGNISQIASAGTKTYGLDDAFRITGITDVTTSALSWSYAYDALDRLSAASTSAQAQSFTYDANGNRLTQGGSTSSVFVPSSTSNRLSSISGALSRTYAYDPAGHVIGANGLTFTYNAAGRMNSASNGSQMAIYVYNALGQRVKKSVSGATTYFVYDETGHLLGEYDGSGALIEEIVWIGDTPVATVRMESCGLSIFYIHTDHLNTPRRSSRTP